MILKELVSLKNKDMNILIEITKLIIKKLDYYNVDLTYKNFNHALFLVYYDYSHRYHKPLFKYKFNVVGYGFELDIYKDFNSLFHKLVMDKDFLNINNLNLKEYDLIRINLSIDKISNSFIVNEGLSLVITSDDGLWKRKISNGKEVIGYYDVIIDFSIYNQYESLSHNKAMVIFELMVCYLDEDKSYSIQQLNNILFLIYQDYCLLNSELLFYNSFQCTKNGMVLDSLKSILFEDINQYIRVVKNKNKDKEIDDDYNKEIISIKRVIENIRLEDCNKIVDMLYLNNRYSNVKGGDFVCIYDIAINEKAKDLYYRMNEMIILKDKIDILNKIKKDEYNVKRKSKH